MPLGPVWTASGAQATYSSCQSEGTLQLSLITRLLARTDPYPSEEKEAELMLTISDLEKSAR